MFTRTSVLTGHVLYVGTCLFSSLFANYGVLECDATRKYHERTSHRACPAFQYNPRADRGAFETADSALARKDRDAFAASQNRHLLARRISTLGVPRTKSAAGDSDD